MLIIFLLMFNTYFFKTYFKILLKGLPTDHIWRYISKSWKRITANVTSTVFSPMNLLMVFCWWYVILTMRNTNGKTKTSMKLNNFFCLLYVKLTDEYINGMKCVIFFFCSLCPSVNLLVHLLPTDHKLPARFFLMNCFHLWACW